jgi:ABC-type lipoprotein export system ATPase subunit
MSDTPAIDARDLFRIYESAGGNAATLQGLTLSVREGEILVVLGPSGSGKSTLLRILAGLDRPSAGRAIVFGSDLAGLSNRRLARYRSAQTGYADQHYSRALAPELTARGLVGLRLGLEGATRAERARRADELLERVGLADKGDSRPHELSGGEQQRVVVCAAVAHRPRVLFADEPTGELDHSSAALLYDVLGDLARAEGCTTVIVSHDPESASIADRIVHVRDGRLSSEWARDEGEDESIVVGRGGWLQLPEELLRRAGVGSRAAARFEGGGIVIVPVEQAMVGQAARPEGLPPASTGDMVAELRAVRKAFASGPPVLDSFDASFASGRLTALTGRSGSGKTTLLRLLAGLDLPDAGEAVVLGTQISSLDRGARAAFRRDHVGVVGQDARLVEFLTAAENVSLGLSLRGVETDQTDAPARAALEAVGLVELADRRANELSAGERERVAIARAIAVRPAVLLADEPTARLDEANARAIAELLGRLARESGTAVVCATHDVAVIDQADSELTLGPSVAPPVAIG